MCTCTLYLHAPCVINTFISRIVLPGGTIDSFVMKHFLKEVKSPTCIDIWGWAAATCLLLGMRFIHSIFNTNPCDIIPFCFFSCWYLFHSVSRHLTHMFRVIKCFQSLEIWCGGRGCIGFEKLGSFAVLNQVGGVWVFHSYSLTHTLDRHTLTPTPPTPPNPNTHTQSQNPSRSFQPN